MLIDGTLIAKSIEDEVRHALAQMKGPPPSLAVLQVGKMEASTLYIRRKMAACQRVGIDARLLSFPESISEFDFLASIQELNQDPFTTAILVQLPLPPQIDTAKVLSAVDPEKDVDGFHPINQGKLISGDRSGFVPCTPLGIQTLLLKTLSSISGKEVVILGRSLIVGKPLGLLLLQNREQANCTVTIAHSYTERLPELIARADIVVAAIGKPQFIQGRWIKKGATVIDVGINRVEGKLVGDVEFEEAKNRAFAITPVPGGVGPMTIASLLQNCLKTAS